MLTDELGRTVVRPDGSRVGRLVDLVVRLGAGQPLVVALIVGERRRTRGRVPWAAVARFAEDVVVSTDPLVDVSGAFELLLGRDVLDTQIFDVQGRRLTRVADVELAWRGDRLEVVGVDVGAAPLLRRLGLGVFARRAHVAVIPWGELHLLSARGHALQLDTPTARVHSLTPDELAELGARLPAHRRSRLHAALHPRAASQARALEPSVPESRPRHRYGRVLRARLRAPS